MLCIDGHSVYVNRGCGAAALGAAEMSESELQGPATYSFFLFMCQQQKKSFCFWLNILPQWIEDEIQKGQMSKMRMEGLF